MQEDVIRGWSDPGRERYVLYIFYLRNILYNELKAQKLYL